MRIIFGLFFVTLLACAAAFLSASTQSQACFAKQLSAQPRPDDVLLAVPEDPATAQTSLPALDMKIGDFHKIFNRAAQKLKLGLALPALDIEDGEETIIGSASLTDAITLVVTADSRNGRVHEIMMVADTGEGGIVTPNVTSCMFTLIAAVNPEYEASQQHQVLLDLGITDAYIVPEAAEIRRGKVVYWGGWPKGLPLFFGAEVVEN
ncbi:hypothetical protein [Nitratidesulfovibrio termitidis]|uniref:hypothetical protein n=1 Tax=Nitratidesulfovibrio termitidis TaxID=42252 RepID=UPI0012EB246F|nr:hypothetical protein [Nitratidesulfovibrio termitidis]